VDDDVWSHAAAEGAGVAELELLSALVLTGPNLDLVLHCSGSSWDAHPADKRAILLN